MPTCACRNGSRTQVASASNLRTARLRLCFAGEVPPRSSAELRNSGFENSPHGGVYRMSEPRMDDAIGMFMSRRTESRLAVLALR